MKSRVIDKSKLNTSDSFVHSHSYLLTCRRCDVVLVPEVYPQGCECERAYYCKECLDTNENAICLECEDVKIMEPLNEVHLRILD